METGSCVLIGRGEGEIIEKKSRFIGEAVPVETEEEALAYLEQVRKRHYNANHHCYAYVIGDKNQLQRCSDDGEPSGTAGKPILNVLTGERIRNALIVVTRYFGGTLLGTGGLVRAYTKGASAALEAARVLERLEGIRYQIDLDYTGLGKLQYIAAQMGLTVEDIQYTDQVAVTVMAPAEMGETFCKKVTEATNGRAVISPGEPLSYGLWEGKVVLL